VRHDHRHHGVCRLYRQGGRAGRHLPNRFGLDMHVRARRHRGAQVHRWWRDGLLCERALWVDDHWALPAGRPSLRERRINLMGSRWTSRSCSGWACSRPGGSPPWSRTRVGHSDRSKRSGDSSWTSVWGGSSAVSTASVFGSRESWCSSSIDGSLRPSFSGWLCPGPYPSSNAGSAGRRR